MSALPLFGLGFSEKLNGTARRLPHLYPPAADAPTLPSDCAHAHV